MQYLLSVRTLAVSIAIIASALVATVALHDETPAAMYITPVSATVGVGETQQFSVVVKSNVPVNTFAGELLFDTDRFNVVDISYNTSIANLWVEEPWYNRASNSVYFAGGTTVPGGFTGEGTLLTVTLQAVAIGDTTLSLHGARIMAHDGLGSEVTLVEPLDTLFMVDTRPYTKPLQKPVDSQITVVTDLPPLDINQDGELSFQDVGVLLLNLGKEKAEYDFTGDGKVTWSDVRQWQQLRQNN